MDKYIEIRTLTPSGGDCVPPRINMISYSDENLATWNAIREKAKTSEFKTEQYIVREVTEEDYKLWLSGKYKGDVPEGTNVSYLDKLKQLEAENNMLKAADATVLQTQLAEEQNKAKQLEAEKQALVAEIEKLKKKTKE